MPIPVLPNFISNPGALPATYRLPDSLDLIIESVTADINGAAASGAFILCLSVYSQDDRRIGRVKIGTEFATGDTGVVTFAPFLKGAAASGSDPDAVKFNVNGQTGHYLDIYTDGVGVAQGTIIIEDHSGDGLYLASEDPGGTTGGFISISTADGSLVTANTETVFRIGAFGDLEIQNANGSVARVRVTEEGYVLFRLGSGLYLNVYNSAGASIFRVDEDGDLHGKTGKALTFDL